MLYTSFLDKFFNTVLIIDGKDWLILDAFVNIDSLILFQCPDLLSRVIIQFFQI